MRLVEDAFGGGNGSGASTLTVDDIATRDAAASTLLEGQVVVVKDASGDPDVGSGAAAYIWDGSTFTKLTEAESATELLNINWTDVNGRPTSSPVTIDNAVAQAHSHVDSDTDIHDAVVKRHEHTNKVVLDLLSSGEPNDETLLFDGREVTRSHAADVVLTVAPDAASRQPGDMTEVGWDGISQALSLSRLYKQGPWSNLVIQLRPGVYDGRGKGVLRAPPGGRVHIQPTTGDVTLPSVGSYVFNDRVADSATLRAAYPVRLEFDNWTCFYVSGDERILLSNILLENVNATYARRGVYADRNATAYLSRVSGVNLFAVAETVYGASIRLVNGSHCMCWQDSGSFIRASGYGIVYAQGSASDRIVAAYGGHFVYCAHGGSATVAADAAKWTYVRTFTYDAFSINFSSRLYAYRVDIDGCRYPHYVTYLSSTRVWDVKIRNNTHPVCYGYGNCNFYISTLDVDNNASATSRMVYMRVNSSCYTAGGHTGTLTYSPDIGTSGNGDSNIRGAA